MARALRLARLGLTTTDPNPRVGCVLVNAGRVVGEGFHRRAGEPHAERLALAQAGGAARGAIAYVSLEPCCHQGRTPPCADALIAAGVARVVAAMRDPNPLVAGQGLAALRAAGIEVHCGPLEQQARALNPGFVKRMERGLPYVRCKLALSLDGRTAMASGESQWITGPAARQDVQRLRARSSAILTGIGTVLADDPALNVRLEAGQVHSLGADYPVRQLIRVVLDPGLAIPLGARLFSQPGETWLLHHRGDPERVRALREIGARVETVPGSGERLEPEAVLRWLAAQGINEVLLESGPTLAGAFVAAGLVDELILYLAPHLMGDQARGLLHLPGLLRMEQRIEFQFQDVRRVGRDLRLTLIPQLR